MKLLLDENLSDWSVPYIADLYPDSAHIRTLSELLTFNLWHKVFIIKIKLFADFPTRRLALLFMESLNLGGEVPHPKYKKLLFE